MTECVNWLLFETMDLRTIGAQISPWTVRESVGHSVARIMVPYSGKLELTHDRSLVIQIIDYLIMFVIKHILVRKIYIKNFKSLFFSF